MRNNCAISFLFGPRSATATHHQNGIKSSISSLDEVATLLGGNGLLVGALPFCALGDGEIALTRTVSFSSGGSARQSL